MSARVALVRADGSQAAGEAASVSGKRARDQPAAGLRRAQAYLEEAGAGSAGSGSPCSLQSGTTDSDSLPSEQGAGQAANGSGGGPVGERRARSPILVKYNYYDYNGARQTNHDMNYNQHQAAGARQPSPTLARQHLDQIVSNGRNQTPAYDAATKHHQHQQAPAQNATMMLARRYKWSSYEQRCLRCAKTVYQMDKVGPLKDFTFYHQNCFKCLECGTKLTLKTYFNSQHSSTDQEVYCHRHCPKTPAGRLDNQSVGIRAALNAPKVFDVQTVGQQPAAPAPGAHCDPATAGQAAHASANGPQHWRRAPESPARPHQAELAGAGGAAPLHSRHALHQSRLQAIYKQSRVDEKISQFLSKRLEYLEPRQKLLEMRHRQEEEALFRAFELKWRQEECSISEQIRREWQLELDKLLDKYKRQLSSMGQRHSPGHHQPEPLGAAADASGHQAGSAAAGAPAPPETGARRAGELASSSNANNNNDNKGSRLDDVLTTQQKRSKNEMIELERINLEKTMTIKLDRKKETLKRKLKEFERQATAELVERQSREMLALISMKLEEFKEEQKVSSDGGVLSLFAWRRRGSSLGAAGGRQVEPAGRPRRRPGPIMTQRERPSDSNICGRP